MEIETVDLQIGCLETVPDFSTLVEYFSVVILPDVALWLQKVIEYFITFKYCIGYKMSNQVNLF